jgi:hypothetical protein
MDDRYQIAAGFEIATRNGNLKQHTGFDTGTTQILGDNVGISNIFASMVLTSRPAITNM